MNFLSNTTMDKLHHASSVRGTEPVMLSLKIGTISSTLVWWVKKKPPKDFFSSLTKFVLYTLDR